MFFTTAVCVPFVVMIIRSLLNFDCDAHFNVSALKDSQKMTKDRESSLYSTGGVERKVNEMKTIVLCGGK